MDLLINEILDLEERIERCWEYFIISRIKEGMEFIDKIFYSIDTIINTINNKKLINININEMQNIFINLEKALKVPDYILIADLLNYEIKPLIQLWRLDLNNIQQRDFV